MKITTPNNELLAEAIELLNAIQTDLVDTLQHPAVVGDMSIKSAKDNTQQLLDTLQELSIYYTS